MPRAREPVPSSEPDALRGRLRARPIVPPGAPARAIADGTHPLGLAPRRDALLFVPATVAAPAPLVVMLHGAGGAAAAALALVEAEAALRGIAVLAPGARGRSWDLIVDELGPDVAFLDRALAATFARLAVDPARLAIAGFSDGASYALTLGLANGDLFREIFAFSPGFAAAPSHQGAPRVYVSHGTRDEVLPIDRTSRRIVPALRRAGYAVDYEEFEGDHAVPPAVVAAAFARL